MTSDFVLFFVFAVLVLGAGTISRALSGNHKG